MSPRPARARKKGVELFVSYAHEDNVWLGRLQPLLEIDETRCEAHAWNDQQMKAGDRWDQEIKAALERMDVFVCLISMDFLLSEYVRTVELPRAFAREQDGEIEIVPIVIYPHIDLKDECKELTAFQPLPVLDKCWREFERDDGDQRDAHGLIRHGLRQAIQKAQEKR